MCGAGTLPARMAAEARRQGWRVIAFAFGDADGVAAHAHRVVPSRIAEMAPVVATLAAEGVTDVVFSGKFWMGDLLRTDAVDDVHAGMWAHAGALLDRNIVAAIETTLAGLGATLLDQRAFLGDWLAPAGCSTARRPTEEEWADVRRGFDAARLAAEASIGQTVVVRRGAVSAVEAIEGTTEAIRRGTALSGRGAVIVKATAPAHDFRFDVPAIGVDTLEAAAAGGATVVAVETDRVLIIERPTTVRRADAAGVALVSTHDGRP